MDCLKIEGRAKSAYYAAIVTGAYRHALDAVAAGRARRPGLARRGGACQPPALFHRLLTSAQPGQYTESSRYIRDWQVCAIVTDCTPDGLATLSLRNKFAAGDEVEIVGPDLAAFSFQAPEMIDADGAPLLQPRHPQMVFQIQLPRPVPPRSMLRRQVAARAK